MEPDSPPPDSSLGRDQVAPRLQAATELLAERSQPATITVRQIAQEAAVSTGLLYSYYGTKHELIVATLLSMAADADALLQDSALGEQRNAQLL